MQNLNQPVYHSANNPVKSGITAHFLVSSLLSREWSVPTLPLDLVGLVGLRRDVRSVPPGLSSTCWRPLEGGTDTGKHIAMKPRQGPGNCSLITGLFLDIYIEDNGYSIQRVLYSY